MLLPMLGLRGLELTPVKLGLGLWLGSDSSLCLPGCEPPGGQAGQLEARGSLESARVLLGL